MMRIGAKLCPKALNVALRGNAMANEIRQGRMKSTSWVISLPAEGGGPSLTVEGECGTFKSAIIIDYAFSPTASRSPLPEGALKTSMKSVRDG